MAGISWRRGCENYEAQLKETPLMVFANKLDMSGQAAVAYPGKQCRPWRRTLGGADLADDADQ